MGAVHSARPAVYPDKEGPIIFDPARGFPEGRKERVCPVTPAQMDTAHIPMNQRDYCADKLIDFKVCVRKNFPLNWRCSHERHAYQKCEYQDTILRIKEFERERRLLERQAKKERRAAKLAAEEALPE